MGDFFQRFWAKFAQTIWSHCQLRKKQKTCFLHRDVGSFDFDVAFQDDDLSTNMTTKRRRRRCCCCCRRRQRRCWHLLPAFVVVFVAAFLYLWTWGRIYLWVTFRLFDNYSWSYSNILNFEKKDYKWSTSDHYKPDLTNFSLLISDNRWPHKRQERGCGFDSSSS